MHSRSSEVNDIRARISVSENRRSGPGSSRNNQDPNFSPRPPRSRTGNGRKKGNEVHTKRIQIICQPNNHEADLAFSHHRVLALWVWEQFLSNIMVIFFTSNGIYTMSGYAMDLLT